MDSSNTTNATSLKCATAMMLYALLTAALTSCGYTDRVRMQSDLEHALKDNDTSHSLKAIEYRKFHRVVPGQELLVAWVDTTGTERYTFGEFLRFDPAPNDSVKNQRLDTLELYRGRSTKLGPFSNLKPWDPYNVAATSSYIVVDADGEVKPIPLWRTDAIVQVKQQDEYNGIDWGRTGMIWLGGVLLTAAGILFAALAGPPDQNSGETVRKGAALGISIWLMLLFLI